jgi:CRISPR-associated protein Cas2
MNTNTDKLYLFCYDLPASKEGNRRRAKLAKILDGHGNRVQYSTFEGRFSNTEELEKVLKKIDKLLVKTEDSLRIYPLPLNVEKEIRVMGLGEVFKREDFYVF